MALGLIRSQYTPYSIYLRVTIALRGAPMMRCQSLLACQGSMHMAPAGASTRDVGVAIMPQLISLFF